MTTKTQNKDLDLLYEIEKVAKDYGVDKVRQTMLSTLEITYEVIGQGSSLDDLIANKMRELAPDRSYRIKMIPSDKKLIVELL